MSLLRQPGTGRGPACWLVLLCVIAFSCVEDCIGQAQNSNDFLAASTPGRFQAAVRAGIKHILITDHLDMTKSPREPDADPEAQALNNGVARIRETTLSVGVRHQVSPLEKGALMRAETRPVSRTSLRRNRGWRVCLAFVFKMTPPFIKFNFLLWLLRRCSVALELRAWLMEVLRITERFLTGTCSAHNHFILSASAHMRPTSVGNYL